MSNDMIIGEVREVDGMRLKAVECNQCTHESVFDLCKYLKNIIIILEEK